MPAKPAKNSPAFFFKWTWLGFTFVDCFEKFLLPYERQNTDLIIFL
jgi:hypothetical protein